MCDERIQVRAYFHWKNHTGRFAGDAVSNWIEAEQDEAFLASLPGGRRWPHTVVDQNKLRDCAILDPNNGPFLLPDVGVAELFKSDEWRYVVERSLAQIARRPDSASLAYSIGDIFREEMASGQLGELIDPVATAAFRSFLSNAAVSLSTAFDAYARSVSDARDLATTQHFDDVKNKLTVVDVRNAWLQELSESELKALRHAAGLESEVAHALLSDGSMLKTIAMMLQSAGYEQTIANNLAYFPSVTGAHCLALVALALQWISRGGLDSATKDKILTNDLADIDYVVASLFCRGYLSTEKKMQALRVVLQRALDALWTRNAEHLLVASKTHESGGPTTQNS